MPPKSPSILQSIKAFLGFSKEQNGEQFSAQSRTADPTESLAKIRMFVLRNGQGMSWSRDRELLSDDGDLRETQYPAHALAILTQLAADGEIGHEPPPHPTQADFSVSASWEQIYRLVSDSGYLDDLSKALEIPQILQCIPVLESRGSFTDTTFAVEVAEWRDLDERSIPVRRLGAAHSPLLEVPTSKSNAQPNALPTIFLMPESVWKLLQQLERLPSQSKQQNEETKSVKQVDWQNRYAWGEAWPFVKESRAQLDAFLRKKRMIVPQKIQLHMRQNRQFGRVLEIMPLFDGCPPNWLEQFDHAHRVPERMRLERKRKGQLDSWGDAVEPEVEEIDVLLTPEIKQILQKIKEIPARRVSGASAEAFIFNPTAALGEEASRYIDLDHFAAERERNGLIFDQISLQKATISSKNQVDTITISVATPNGQQEIQISPEEARRLQQSLQEALQEKRQLCAWSRSPQNQPDQPNQPNQPEFEFEILGDTYVIVEKLEHLLHKDWNQPWNQNHLSERIAGVGIFEDIIIEKIEKETESWLPAPEEIAPPTMDLGHITAPSEEISVHEEPNQRQKSELLLKENYVEVRSALLQAPTKPIYPQTLLPTYQLKPHQEVGVAWLQHLFMQSPFSCRGALLADDMGLGKTLQTLAFLAWIFEQNPNEEPALIVAPVALLENWQQEITRFFGKNSILQPICVYGHYLKQVRKVSLQNMHEPIRTDVLQYMPTGLGEIYQEFLSGWRQDKKVILTTYETLRDYEYAFAVESWSVMICDEAQKIKNPNAMMTRAAKKQKVRFKIACTGTPVENSLVDLWSLFDFIQPGLLGSLATFHKKYRRPIEAETETHRKSLQELRDMINPQILRRMKHEVAKDLPQKIIAKDTKMQISVMQREWYAYAAHHAGNFKNMLTILHYIRHLCTHPQPPQHAVKNGQIQPYLWEEKTLSEYQNDAPKMAWLLKTLREIQKKQEKVLIFCEFRDVQAMLKFYLEQSLGCFVDIVNGDTITTPDHAHSRHQRIQRFQQKAGFAVLILSPIAVGFGVNIQAANHVIHYMRMWNPAKEDQATDRAYRIGQTRDVYVYCPTVTATEFKTFDVKLDELLTEKRRLAADVLNGDSEITERDFSLQEIAPPR